MDAKLRFEVSSTKTVLAVVASRLRETIEHLDGLLSAPDAALADHELLNLQDIHRKLREDLKYVDEVFKEKQRALRRSK